MKVIKLFLILLFLNISLCSYESEDKLKVVIVGKVAKYISWQENNSSSFVITVLNNQFESLFDETYLDKTIKERPVKLKYIDDINDLTATDILYVSHVNPSKLANILEQTKYKNILTISDERGFAQKGGILQLYFIGQKLKLRMNLDIAQEEGFDIDIRLLRIVEIQKKDD